MKIGNFYIGNKTQNKLLLFLCLLLALWLIYLMMNRITPKEGFEQSDRFVLRRNQDMYDDFLARIYDKIYQPKSVNQYVFDAVEKMTQPSQEQSVFLDAGSGTGELVHYISSKGYRYAFGMDRSEDMIAISQEKYPDIQCKVGDLSVPMTYDKHTFTHILMTGNTIYQFADKIQLLRNLYYWLTPHGFLIIHLCDREKFDPIPALGKPILIDALQSLVQERVTDSEITFPDFVYQSSYDFSRVSRDQTVMFQETFTDAKSHHTRKNEMVLYMESLNDIVYMAQYVGFLVHGQMNLLEANQDKHQYIFVLQRPY